MGLFDKLKDKATEAVSGVVDSAVDSAKESVTSKVSDVTGVDADKVLGTVESLNDARESLVDAADSIGELRKHD